MLTTFMTLTTAAYSATVALPTAKRGTEPACAFEATGKSAKESAVNVRTEPSSSAVSAFSLAESTRNTTLPLKNASVLLATVSNKVSALNALETSSS